MICTDPPEMDEARNFLNGPREYKPQSWKTFLGHVDPAKNQIGLFIRTESKSLLFANDAKFLHADNED